MDDAESLPQDGGRLKFDLLTSRAKPMPEAEVELVEGLSVQASPTIGEASSSISPPESPSYSLNLDSDGPGHCTPPEEAVVTPPSSPPQLPSPSTNGVEIGLRPYERHNDACAESGRQFMGTRCRARHDSLPTRAFYVRCTIGALPPGRQRRRVTNVMFMCPETHVCQRHVRPRSNRQEPRRRPRLPKGRYKSSIDCVPISKIDWRRALLLNRERRRVSRVIAPREKHTTTATTVSRPAASATPAVAPSAETTQRPRAVGPRPARPRGHSRPEPPIIPLVWPTGPMTPGRQLEFADTNAAISAALGGPGFSVRRGGPARRRRSSAGASTSVAMIQPGSCRP